jgi:hypothetical protein
MQRRDLRHPGKGKDGMEERATSQGGRPSCWVKELGLNCRMDRRRLKDAPTATMLSMRWMLQPVSRVTSNTKVRGNHLDRIKKETSCCELIPPAWCKHQTTAQVLRLQNNRPGMTVLGRKATIIQQLSRNTIHPILWAHPTSWGSDRFQIHQRPNSDLKIHWNSTKIETDHKAAES